MVIRKDIIRRHSLNLLKGKGLGYKEQIYFPLRYRDKIIGKCFFDFIVNDSIVVELKKGNNFSKKNIDQVLEYLKTSDLKLAILINFGSSVSFKRIINFGN